MAHNTIHEAPDFDRIRTGDGHVIEDAIRLLWFSLQDEILARRRADRVSSTRLSPKVLLRTPSGNENNVDTQDAGLIVYTGSSAVNITGYRAPAYDGAVLFVFVAGSATVTHQNQHASSDAGNRMVFQSGADTAVAQNKAFILVYYSSRWREMSLV